MPELTFWQLFWYTLEIGVLIIVFVRAAKE